MDFQVLEDLSCLIRKARSVIETEGSPWDLISDRTVALETVLIDADPPPPCWCLGPHETSTTGHCRNG